MVRGANHLQQWSELRRRTSICWVVVLSYLPGVVLFAVFSSWLVPKLAGTIVPVVALAGLFAIYVSFWYRLEFSCPNCGAYFFKSLRWSNVFARACLHCGLRRGADPASHVG